MEKQLLTINQLRLVERYPYYYKVIINDIESPYLMSMLRNGCIFIRFERKKLKALKNACVRDAKKYIVEHHNDFINIPDIMKIKWKESFEMYFKNNTNGQPRLYVKHRPTPYRPVITDEGINVKYEKKPLFSITNNTGIYNNESAIPHIINHHNRCN